MTREELAIQLEEGFKHTTFEEKVVLQLVYYEDLSDAEVCEVMGIGFEELGMILCNAKTKMRAFTSIFDDIDGIGKRGISLMH